MILLFMWSPIEMYVLELNKYVLLVVDFEGIPDGHGRKFLVTSPDEAVETLITIRNATSATFHDVAYSAPDQILQKM